MANMISGILDTDQENIKSQLAYADALRKKSLNTDGEMVSGFYVPKNPWQNFVEGLMGGGVEGYQRDKQRSIEQEQTQARQDFLGSIPQAGETRQMFDPQQQAFGPTEQLTDQYVPKSTRQYAQEMQQWATKAPKGMEGIQAFGIQQALQAPEKQAELEQKAQDRQHEILAKAREAQMLQQERLAAEARQAEMYRRTAAQQEKYLYAALAAARSTNPHTQIAYGPDGKGYLVDMRSGAELPLGSVGKAPNAGKAGIAGLPVKAQATWSALQNLDSATKAYETLLKSYNPQSTDALDMEKRAAIKGAFTDLQMRQKEAFELGAITGPDMQILEGAYTDPTGMWGGVKGAVTGSKPFEAQITQGRAALNRTKKNFEQQYNVEIPEPAGTFQAPMPGAAPSGFKVLSVREK